jgi:hypothetical protein
MADPSGLDRYRSFQNLEVDEVIIECADGNKGVIAEPDHDIVFELEFGLAADS